MLLDFPSARVTLPCNTMSQVLILQHNAFFAPGRLQPIFRDYGIPCQIRRIDKGDEVPTDLDEIRMLVVLGDTVRLSDSQDSRPGYIAQELETLSRLVQADRPVLGIGTGAQLLALAAGAKVHRNVKPGPNPETPGTPMPEFGWGPVNFPFPGGTEPIVFGMVDASPFFHWHADTFDLPKLPAPQNPPPGPPPPTGNALLASSPKTRNQAFRFKNRLFGFQFHFELTEAELEQIPSSDSKAIEAAGVTAEQIRSDTKTHYARYARLGDRLTRNLVQFLRAYNP